MSTVQSCVNHPDTETRLSCSACEAPICVRCIRQSPVGQKCPTCARVPRSARAVGKPLHYVRAVAAGVAAALAGAVVLGLLLAQIRFGALILSGLVGFGVGRAVSWGAHRQSQQPFPAIAITCSLLAVAGGLVLVFGTPVPPGGFLLLAYAVAGWLAHRGLHG
jgi:hypothetical protein